MIKLARYLKPYIGLLIITFMLLFIQGITDLNLPNYMSNIVNVGIQQNGISHATPEAIDANGLNFMTSFMTPTDRASVLSAYEEVSPGDTAAPNYKTLLAKYPALEEESIYRLVDSSIENLEALDPIFGQATWTFIYFIRSLDTDMAAADQNADMTDLDFSQIYDLLPMLSQVPPESLETARDQALQTPEAMQIQTAIQFTRQFYGELGVDLGAIQNQYILRIGGIMLLLSLLSILAAIGVGFLAAKMAAGVSQCLRRDLFAKVQSFSSKEFNDFSTASLITRNTNDVTQMQVVLIMGIRILCYAPILAVGGIIMALRKATSMGWIILLAVLLIIMIIAIVFTLAMPRFKRSKNSLTS